MMHIYCYQTLRENCIFGAVALSVEAPQTQDQSSINLLSLSTESETDTDTPKGKCSTHRVSIFGVTLDAMHMKHDIRLYRLQ